jgi:hypothetical protein
MYLWNYFKLLWMENTSFFFLSINRSRWWINIHKGERPSDGRYAKENGGERYKRSIYGRMEKNQEGTS